MIPCRYHAELLNDNCSRASHWTSSINVAGWEQPHTCVTNAEILRFLNIVTLDFSYNSLPHTGKFFKKMFPDSEIAKAFSYGEKKSHVWWAFSKTSFFSRVPIMQLIIKPLCLTRLWTTACRVNRHALSILEHNAQVCNHKTSHIGAHGTLDCQRAYFNHWAAEADIDPQHATWASVRFVSRISENENA